MQVLVSASYDDTIKMYREELDDWSAFSTLGLYDNDFDNNLLPASYKLQVHVVSLLRNKCCQACF